MSADTDCHPGPDFSVADVYRGWAEALRNLGHEVAMYNTNDRLTFYCKALLDTGEFDEQGLPIVKQAMPLKDAVRTSMQGLTHAAYTFWPDVVLFVSGFWIEPGIWEIMRMRNHKLVLLHTECPYEDVTQVGRAQYMDVNLLNDPTNIAVFESQSSGPVLYMPHAYRPEIHYPRAGKPDPELSSDAIFIGTAFQSRINFMEKMDFTGVDFLLGGANWEEDLSKKSHLRKYLDQDEPGCIDNDQAAELYRNAKLSFNLYRQEGEDNKNQVKGWAMGPREVELAACGLFFLRDPRAEGDRVLGMLPTFTGPEDASEQIKYWLGRDDKREELARRARAAVEDRTFENNAKRLLKALDDL